MGRFYKVFLVFENLLSLSWNVVFWVLIVCKTSNFNFSYVSESNIELWKWLVITEHITIKATYIGYPNYKHMHTGNLASRQAVPEHTGSVAQNMYVGYTLIGSLLRISYIYTVQLVEVSLVNYTNHACKYYHLPANKKIICSLHGNVYCTL